MQGAFSGESQKALVVSRRMIMRMRRDWGASSRSLSPIGITGAADVAILASDQTLHRPGPGRVSESESGG